jgi:PBP superfamily domain
MRTSIVGAAFLLAGAGAATVAAVDTTGSNLALNGSDTLFDVTNAVIASCGTQFSDFNTLGISYLGGGSGVGAGQMDLNAQQVSPMSRPLKNTEFCSIAAPSAAGLAEGLLVGIDGVAIAANQTNSCSSSVANGFGSTAAFAVTADGTAAGGAPATCPGCVGTNYTFADSFDALKVLYFGQTHDGTFDCASPVRKSLVKNWRNLFTSDCAAGDATCSAGLTHAWRRSDLSGTTDAFVSVLNPTGKGIGTLSTAPVGAAKKANPFCNSSDAQVAGQTSFGGSSDFQDLDPIRTNCVTGKDGVCEPFKNFATAGGAFAGDLGVVLPVLIPDSASTVPSDLYPQVACGTTCTLVAPIRLNQIPAGFKCPGGSTPTLGLCFMPENNSTAHDPRCIAGPQSKCFDIVGRPDGRQYNLATVVATSQINPAGARGSTAFQFARDANSRFMFGDYYRVHSTTAGANNVPDAVAGTTGLCQENDDTSQIGCLTDSDPCSVGYAGREAAKSYPGTGTPATPQPANLKALAVNGTPPFTPASVNADPDTALKNLLAPAGTTPLYPLSRRLYFATIYGFGNLQGGEKELAACYGTNSIVTSAVSSHGFVAIPGGVQCLDYPETAGTASPAPNVQGAGNVALGGCGNATDTNACSVSPPVIQ